MESLLLINEGTRATPVDIDGGAALLRLHRPIVDGRKSYGDPDVGGHLGDRAELTSAASDAEVSSSTDVVVLRPVMWMFVAILVTYLATRLITRRIRRQQRAAELAAAEVGDARDGSGGLLRNVSLGGVHIHHQVFGILLMCSVGIAPIGLSPQGTALNICAALFGVGVSLAFDEFALWLHLDDVYWSPADRKSVDAIFCRLIIVGILVGGVDFLTGAVVRPTGGRRSSDC